MAGLQLHFMGGHALQWGPEELCPPALPAVGESCSSLSRQAVGTWARRDQLAEAGAGVWDLRLCRAEGVQAIYNPSSPPGNSDSKVWVHPWC